MARFVPPIFRDANSSFSDAGSGYKLYFYSTGTTSAKDTFSDSALSSANTNPVIADSAGRFGDIFMEAGTYRVILTDADDVEIWDADPVDGAVGASGEVISKTAAYTVVIGDLTKVINCDASGGAFTITLLDAATAGDGGEITIKKDEADTTTNAVTIDGNGAETVNGTASITLNIAGSAVTLRCNGSSNWEIVAATAEIFQGFALQGTLTPPQITADQNNYSPTGLALASVLRLDTDAARKLTGLAGGTKGKIRIIHYVGANTLILSDEDALSTAANRFSLLTSLTLQADQTAVLQYDATSSRWRLLAGPPATATDTVAGILETATQTEQETASATDKTVTPGRQQYHPSAAKCWVQFDTSGAIRASYNVSSITDGGAGDWTVNINNDMSSTDYAAWADANPSSASAKNISFGVLSTAASSFTIRGEDSGGTLSDPEGTAYVSAGAFGDLP